MAHIMISEEHYRELVEMAQARGMTPDALADELIEQQIIAADQRAFWGDDIDIHIETSLQDLGKKSRHIMTDEEFLADAGMPNDGHCWCVERKEIATMEVKRNKRNERYISTRS